MASLVEGQQYGLSSKTSTSPGLTLTHVKLTDSALRAFEEFLKFKETTSRRPSIQFKAQNGEIRIPVKKSSENTEGFQKFTFSLSTPMIDAKSSFECVQQSSRNGGDPLNSLGTLSQKMSVQASDDVYDRTREQMRIVEEDAKKKFAQEIKMNDRKGRKVVKRVIKNSNHHSSSSNSSANKTPAPKPSSQHSPQVSYRTSNNMSSIKKPSSQSPASLGAHRTSHSPSYNKPSQSSPAPAAPGLAAPGQGGKSSPNPAIMNLPYRERVIHLLAVRSYKKPELMLKLHKDGVPEKYKHSLSQVLQQVAQYTKDNSFVLQKHLYSEVRLDWPAYNDQDKEIVKRRLTQLEATTTTTATTTPSAGSSPALSPAHSNSSQGSSPSSSHKRPTSTTDEEPPPNKKQRVAHESKRPSPSHRWGDKDKMPSPSTTQHSPSVSTTTPDSTSFNSKTNPYSPVNSSVPSPTKPTPPNSNPKAMSPKHKVLTDLSRGQHRNNGSTQKEERPHPVSQSGRHQNQKTSRPNNHHHVDKQVVKGSTKSLASSTSEIPDYVLDYTEINSPEQRQKYKNVFNAEYEEYRQLHSDVEKVTRKFKELEASLRQQEEGTVDYELIKSDIFNQYRIVKKDTSYVKKRKRWDYLHRKLAHIKKIIMAYDTVHGS